MNDVYEWFTGLATPGGIAYFAAGFAAAFIARWVRCKVKHRKLYIPWRYLGIAIGVSVIVTVSLQSSQAYTTAKETALEQKACQKEFNASLKARSQITSENDELSQQQRQILFDWIHDLIFPPQPYASMTTDDPRRQDYGMSLTINTDRVFKASLERQDALQKQRDEHPLPDPTCGR
jgi:hypothetical protein